MSDRKIILAQSWRKNMDLIILDELHKHRPWKNFLKGVIDQYHNTPALKITGSAKLEILKKAGDALTARTFSYHLHPINIAEAISINPKVSEKSRNITFMIAQQHLIVKPHDLKT